MENILLPPKGSSARPVFRGLIMVLCISVPFYIFLGHYVKISDMKLTYTGYYSLKEFNVNNSNITKNKMANSGDKFSIAQQNLENIVKTLVKTGTTRKAENKQENVKIKQNRTIPAESVKKSPKPQQKSYSSQFSCDNCFVHNYSYLIENNEACKLQTSGQVIDVLFVILTVHGNFDARQALRSTWLTVTKGNKGNIRYVFLLGKIKDETLSAKVMNENAKYKDIIQEDFKDSYINLTLKTMMGFKWAVTQCPHAKTLIKTDDDMYINVPTLLKVIESNRHELPNAVLGSCSSSAAPNRNTKSKWFASVTSYTDNRYPGFCSGTCYVTSMHVAQKVYKISRNIPFFHLEDVYIGLCLRKINVRVKNVPGFNRIRPKLDPCMYRGPTLVTSHMMTPKMLVDIWAQKC